VKKTFLKPKIRTFLRF